MKRYSKKIAVGIPAYNEEKTIGSVLSKTSTYFDQIIVGDDGSTDRTATIAQDLGAIVLRHETNEGYGAILKKIFKKAKQLDVDILVTMDGDGQHNPEDLEKIISPILNGNADIVIGSRFLDPVSIEHVPYLRRIAIQIVTWVINNTSNNKITDSQSGYRAYSRHALETLDFTDRNMGASLEILYHADTNSHKIVEISTIIQYPKNQKTYNMLAHGVELFSSILKHLPSSPPINYHKFGVYSLALSIIIWLSRIFDSN